VPITDALVITGGIGAGKTSVAIEIGETLEAEHVPVAVVDVDWLVWASAPSLHCDDCDAIAALLRDNLTAIAANFASRGVTTVVLPRAVSTEQEAAAIAAALPQATIEVVRLDVTEAEAVRRITARDGGQVLEQHLSQLERVVQLTETIYSEATVVETHERSVPDVAAAVLAAIDWPAKLERRG
jgi:adenylylsulfate kinase-like enzyme